MRRVRRIALGWPCVTAWAQRGVCQRVRGGGWGWRGRERMRCVRRTPQHSIVSQVQVAVGMRTCSMHICILRTCTLACQLATKPSRPLH